MIGHQKFLKLVEYFNQYRSSAIAFSGGMDSSLLLCAAFESQKEHTIALTAKTDFFTWEEWYLVRDITEEIGVRNEQIVIDVLSEKIISQNPKDRCYYCKKKILTEITKAAYDSEIIAEGSNVDDLTDYRPGRKAIDELNIKSPLLELGFGKEDIKEMLKAIGRGYYIKLPNACLATRIKTGEEITKEKLEFVQNAEIIIKKYAKGIIRARFSNGDITVQSEECISEGKILEKLKVLGAKNIYFEKYEKSGKVNV